MRALAFSDFDTPPEVQEIPRPEPASGEIRVRLAAASLNGFDLAVSNGYLKDFLDHRFPVVLGKDFAGTVDALGEGVNEYAVGDRVFGVVTKPFAGDGSLGEFVTVPVAVGVAPLPDAIEFAEAAALGLAGSTALVAMAKAEIQPGRTILVVGAPGGVGSQAIQLAVRAGAHVIATAHTEAEHTHVTALGAHEVVDPQGDVAAAVLGTHPGGVDAVLHLAGDPAPLLAALSPTGRLISTLIASPDQLPSRTGAVVPISAEPTKENLTRLAAAQADGHTRVVIQKRYRLDEATAALADFADGTLGKIVVLI